MDSLDFSERWRVFLDSLLMEENEALNGLRRRCEEEHFPIIRRETEYFLRWLIKGKHPKNILEIGTALGYSSIYMASQCEKYARITTIEIKESSAQSAMENISSFGFGDRIQVVCRDACEWIADRPKDERFDLIFLDGPKGQYYSMLKPLVSLLEEGGVLVADNILQDGDTLESRFAVRRRDRTIHGRMRDFLQEITHTKGLYSDILRVGDGLCVCVKEMKS